MKFTDKIPKQFYEENRKKFLFQLDNFSVAVLFAGEAPYKTGDEFYVFTPNRNFLYLTGLDCHKIIYFAYKTYGKTEEIIFIERNDPQKERWIGKILTVSEVMATCGIRHVRFLDEFEEVVLEIVSENKINNMYLDLENRFGRHLQQPALNFYETFKRNFPVVKIKDGGNILHAMRAVKADYEIELIKKAVNITGVAVEHILNSITPGMYEYQIESCFDFALRFNGVKERAFASTIAGGVNANILHYTANDRIVPENTLVLMDFGATWNYYNADIARTFPISGKFSERQKELYSIVLEAQRKVIEAIKPGVTINVLNEVMHKYYRIALKEAELINKKIRGGQLDDIVRKFCPHSVSHSLGLDAHDLTPDKGTPLQIGMVITVEPGLYVESEGIGIRIEDDILVTEDGCINISEAIPKTVEEIENSFSNTVKGILYEGKA